MIGGENKFIYRSTTADKVIVLLLVGFMWSGTIFDWDGFSNAFNARLLTSSAMLYLSWHFFASRQSLFIQMNHEGINIPSLWLPGLTSHTIQWHQVKGIEFGCKRGLATIHIRTNRLFPFRLYKKCVRINGMAMISSSDASIKLMQELKRVWKESK